jgi:hypothetical protein
VDEDNGLHLKATLALLEDTLERGSDLEAWVYGKPTAGLQRSPDNPHDYWSEEAAQPRVAARVDGTLVGTYLAGLCVSGKITVIPPFQPDFNNC